MKIFKIMSNLLLLVAAAFLGYSYVNKKGIFSKIGEGFTTSEVVSEGIASASFSNLVNHEGVTVSSSDFGGKYMLVMFGFSACKYTCPTELGMASQLLNKLGSSADKLQVVFITIDPKNDTVAKLKEYRKAFDARIQMLTGEEADIKSVVENYKVYVGDKKPSDGDIDHSTFMYLINEKGRYVGHFAPDFNASESQGEELFKFVSGHMLNA
ncbi:major surface protein 5 [Anaplasma centrale str. Israel]|uniref:Major surface protein 5 n=1 Tax=Anaplasma centrale (strain Israel) TaxID=574556 RepID=D1AST2_ANACI|nr:SCO family protein [Anaplasma centrale]ACZ49535.1 major surface protein 5 [Anaplasma centrale str. Israel]